VSGAGPATATYSLLGPTAPLTFVLGGKVTLLQLSTEQVSMVSDQWNPVERVVLPLAPHISFRGFSQSFVPPSQFKTVNSVM
jgi:hypothetical protein